MLYWPVNVVEGEGVKDILGDSASMIVAPLLSSKLLLFLDGSVCFNERQVNVREFQKRA